MPVINNPYNVDESNYAYAPSDLDLNHRGMSQKDINALIDSMCKTRMENPDVVMMDNVKNDEGEEKCEIEEYTLEMQNEKFNSMQHIINQQERYLKMSLDFDLKDSW